MTKTLTEQWKKKELKDGDYYVLNKAGYIVCDYYIEILGHFDSVLTENVKEVLAPVPSYDEYAELLKKLDELEKQLGIAINALKEYSESDNWFMEDSEGNCWSFNKKHPWRIGFKALKEIEEVK